MLFLVFEAAVFFFLSFEGKQQQKIQMHAQRAPEGKEIMQGENKTLAGTLSGQLNHGILQLGSARRVGVHQGAR